MSKGYAKPAEPSTITDPRCRECGKLLARKVTRPWLIECVRCGEANGRPRPERDEG